MTTKIFFILVFFLSAFSMNAQVSYAGNGNNGFGGTLGQSNLDISDDGTDITFKFTRGTNGNLDDNVVIYIDSKSGGFANTGSLNDSSSGESSAVSASNGTNSPTITFPNNFAADYALVFSYNFAIIFELTNTPPFIHISGVSINPYNNNSAVNHTMTTSLSDIGITSTGKFNYIATYITSDASLSNEVIGETSSIIPDNGGINPGFTGSITFSESKTYPNTWTGEISSDWATTDNWTNGVPDTNDIIHIPSDLINYPTAADVTIQKGVIKSGASLIANSLSGTITYERNLISENWYLIASPVLNETYDDDFISRNNLAINGNNNAVAPYDNSDDSWSYYQTNTGSKPFISGVGYSVKRASNSGQNSIYFTGDFNSNSSVNASVDNKSNNGGSGFNLVGNPYSSYLAINSTGNSTNNILSENSSLLSEQTLWLWNQETGIYEIRNNLSDEGNEFIAPGQGFFVDVSGTGTFRFVKEMQSHQTQDSFQKTNTERPEIKLFLSDGTDNKYTEIYYVDGTTKGFDNGYDSSIFEATNHNFNIYTQSISNSIGKRLGLQCLPNSNHEDMVIPIGIIANGGKQITFSAKVINLPKGLKVYLEDKVNGTFIRLDGNDSEHVITLEESMNDVGRFYLHTRSNTLQTTNNDFENISIYTTDSSTLKISGINQEKVNLKLFNILGKEVFNKNIYNDEVGNISLPKLASGIYIVELAINNIKITRKIILK